MVDKMMRIAGRGDDGKAKSISTDDGGLLKIVHGNKAIEEFTIINAAEIRDVANKEFSINLSKYKSVTYMMVSTLDADVDVTVKHEGPTIKVFDGNGFVELKTTLTASEKHFKIILNSALPELNNNFLSLMFRVKCATIPTTGTLTLKGYGELR